MTNIVAVCLKYVFQPDEPGDARYGGVSLADQAALELALQWAAHQQADLTAITVGPPAADDALRTALACGAQRALRVDAAPATPSSAVAAMIASVVNNATWIFCGDYSTDNGTGSVPAFVAAALNARQALGVVNVSFAADGLVATRRLDGGRREVLDVRAPAVVSVEGATARLRRASLAATRTAATATIAVVPAADTAPAPLPTVRAYRPRARALPTPTGDDVLSRVRSLTAATSATAMARELESLAPHAAARRIVRALHDWGYVSADPS